MTRGGLLDGPFGVAGLLAKNGAHSAGACCALCVEAEFRHRGQPGHHNRTCPLTASSVGQQGTHRMRILTGTNTYTCTRTNTQTHIFTHTHTHTHSKACMHAHAHVLGFANLQRRSRGSLNCQKSTSMSLNTLLDTLCSSQDERISSHY
jgi:ABC-type nickel/cobalt efflux system permease component RcnA